ncbi:MAG: ATP-binding protein [Anaerovoracaceae bacterium]|jgi:DNA replication protein DnaC
MKLSEILSEKLKDLEMQGVMTDITYDCPKCRDTGMIVKEIDGMQFGMPCECQTEKAYMRRLQKSGLAKLAEEKRLDNFCADLPYQQRIKRTAAAYIADNGDRWFYIGGQVGCGKTHICTAIAVQLIRQGNPLRYMLWRDEATGIKALACDAEKYKREIEKYKAVRVLYIDDLFKGKVTEADVNLAFEILNHRYNAGLRTIISSEYQLSELKTIDEAISSRILEMSRGYRMDVRREDGRNFREHADQKKEEE